ncbi:MAG TPA: GNAT family N-acetyltransferase [Opitutaceae bacterium]|jgi:hypothetical protein|nr:GNAT family N-acetyltransferase [Opitutaceae bacterium]
MEVNSILTGRRGISLPFTDECEPLSQDQASFRKCYDRILSHAREHNWRYVEMRGGKRFMENALTSTQFYGHELDLGFDEETLFKNIEPSVRRAIRKAEQSVLTVECSQGEEAVKSFYRLLCKTRKRLGVPPQPYSFFREIQKEVISNGLGWVMLARNGSRPVAGAVFFVNGQKATYKFGASDDKFQHLRANNLVMWSAIRKLRAEGARSLDFGRTTLSNEGLRKFKLGWGTTERTIDYVRYDLRTSSNVTKTDASSGWHSAIFKALPTPLSRLIGVALYKHIA